MSEPTIEEMRDAVIAACPESVVFHAGDDTFCILPDGEVSFPDRISGWAENEDVAWHYAYRRLPAKAAPGTLRCVGCEGKPGEENNPCKVCGKASPENEDEAFEHKFKHKRFCECSKQPGCHRNCMFCTCRTKENEHKSSTVDLERELYLALLRLMSGKGSYANAGDLFVAQEAINLYEDKVKP